MLLKPAVHEDITLLLIKLQLDTALYLRHDKVHESMSAFHAFQKHVFDQFFGAILLVKLNPMLQALPLACKDFKNSQLMQPKTVSKFLFLQPFSFSSSVCYSSFSSSLMLHKKVSNRIAHDFGTDQIYGFFLLRRKIVIIVTKAAVASQICTKENLHIEFSRLRYLAEELMPAVFWLRAACSHSIIIPFNHMDLKSGVLALFYWCCP